MHAETLTVSSRSRRIATGAQCVPMRMQSAVVSHARSVPGICVSAAALHTGVPSQPPSTVAAHAAAGLRSTGGSARAILVWAGGADAEHPSTRAPIARARAAIT